MKMNLMMFERLRVDIIDVISIGIGISIGTSVRAVINIIVFNYASFRVSLKRVVVLVCSLLSMLTACSKVVYFYSRPIGREYSRALSVGVLYFGSTNLLLQPNGTPTRQRNPVTRRESKKTNSSSMES